MVKFESATLVLMVLKQKIFNDILEDQTIHRLLKRFCKHGSVEDHHHNGRLNILIKRYFMQERIIFIEKPLITISYKPCRIDVQAIQDSNTSEIS